MIIDLYVSRFQVLIHLEELIAHNLLVDCTTSAVQEVRIQLLTQLTYNNCAQYVPMVDLALTLPISIQQLLINLTRTITLIFK